MINELMMHSVGAHLLWQMCLYIGKKVPIVENNPYVLDEILHPSQLEILIHIV